ncbi:MAG: aldose 1-epimerase family protein [Limisphaerales bacterium]
MKASFSPLLAAGLLLLPPASAEAAPEPFRHTLTSIARGVQVDQWALTARDLGLPGGWSIRKMTLRGGRQEGVDVILVDNGKLTFTVVPTRGMSLLEATCEDVRLGWDSPVKEVVHPQFIELGSRGGLGWLEGFNEFMVRCGMEWAGHPGRDEFINNVGDKAEMDLTLHGKIGNIPASEVEVVVDLEPPHRLRVRGRVDERMFHGPQLVLWTEVSTEPGSVQFRVNDSLKNEGTREQEFQVIYHANFGPPLLGAGARFIGALERITPFNAHAAKSVGAFHEFAPPVSGFVEQVYCLRPLADPAGNTMMMLVNARGDRAASMVYKVTQLPYFTLWKNTGALPDGYVTGLEPGTGFPYNRRLERRAGRVPRLKPGETREFQVDFAIHLGADMVKTGTDSIARIADRRPVQVDREPARFE